MPSSPVQRLAWNELLVLALIHHDDHHFAYLRLRQEDTLPRFPAYEQVCSKSLRLTPAKSLLPDRPPCRTRLAVLRSLIRLVTCSRDTVFGIFPRSISGFCFAFCSTTDGRTNAKPKFLNTRLSHVMFLFQGSSAFFHSQLSHCLDFPHMGKVQRPRWCTKRNQFLPLSCSRITLHMIDQLFAHVTRLLLILEGNMQPATQKDE